jgi:PadR family transcriptional regulator, regulatory protein PadR
MERARRPSPQTVSVLLALAEEPSRWSYGYDLCRSLGLKAGTVYPILIRLAERGDVHTKWEQDVPSGRPPRHLYRLSPRGAKFVAELRPDVAAVPTLASANPATGHSAR